MAVSLARGESAGAAGSLTAATEKQLVRARGVVRSWKLRGTTDVTCFTVSFLIGVHIAPTQEKDREAS